MFDGGRMHPARIVEVQWLTAIVPTGGDVSVVLATEAHGEIRIEGRTYGSTFSVQGNSLHLEWPPPQGHPNPVTFHQGGAVYTWDGETTRGMVERSLPEHRIDRSAT